MNFPICKRVKFGEEELGAEQRGLFLRSFCIPLAAVQGQKLRK